MLKLNECYFINSELRDMIDLCDQIDVDENPNDPLLTAVLEQVDLYDWREDVGEDVYDGIVLTFRFLVGDVTELNDLFDYVAKVREYVNRVAEDVDIPEQSAYVDTEFSVAWDGYELGDGKVVEIPVWALSFHLVQYMRPVVLEALLDSVE